MQTERLGVPLRNRFFFLVLCLAVSAQSHATRAADETTAPASIIEGRIVASGIPGAGSVSAVGVFHAGGPIHDKPAFAAYAAAGRVLDPTRILITSTSNFGSPRMPGFSEGSVLSIDAIGPQLRIPASFAEAGGQASALGGRVQLFTSASPMFANGVNSPEAVTANLPSVSNPLGISINNAFGRLWFPSMPHGASRPGFESILDPTGIPLANAPDKIAGGVFTESKTNRAPQQTPGALSSGLVANALLGQSPDGSKRAVFAVLAADGSLTQAHTEVGIDGLAPAGTITSGSTRAGMIFNWVPNRILYVTDAARNAILAIAIGDDGKVFTASSPRLITSPALHAPIDLAPAIPEVANGLFSSNTTLAGNADMYVLNTDGSIVRMRQDGSLIAIRRVRVAGTLLGTGRLRGIATASDAAHLWLTVRASGDGNADGSLIEIPAFGAAIADATRTTSEVAVGETLFRRTFTPQMGLGPLFNERSCVACHMTPSPGGMGRDGLAIVARVARIDGAFDALTDRGGPVARAHSVSELGFACSLVTGIPALANVTSLRNTLALYDDGAIDALSDESIVAGATAYADGVHGRPNWIDDTENTRRIGRFGWKADVARLDVFVAQALRNEIGITNPLFPHDITVSRGSDRPCVGESVKPEDDGSIVRTLTAYIASLRPPMAARVEVDRAGSTTFAAIGCSECHAMRLRVGSSALYSDLLLHDMGPGLDDGFIQGRAQGRDWRTTALHGAGMRRRFLHDGRALTIRDAVLAHDGEAEHSVQRYRSLDRASQDAVVRFVATL